MPSVPVVTTEQALHWDRLASERGIPFLALMESAGRGIATVLTNRFSAAVSRGVIVAAGPGNNGGDGWVIARTLHAHGIPVWVVAVPATSSELNILETRLARSEGVRSIDAEGPWPGCGLAVDALLGTGARGAPRAAIRSIMTRLHELAVPIVAVDGPTGLDLDTGVSYDALVPTLTCTFGGFRRGHLLARDEIGDAIALDIGLGPGLPEWPTLFSETDAARAMPNLPAGTHKGERGRIVVIGGDRGMTGAARMAARAAFAAGAGLVHLMGPADSVAVWAQAEPDLQTTVSDLSRLDDPGAALLERADAIVVGPGLGRQPERMAFVERVLEVARSPVVLDADALTAFGGNVGSLAAKTWQRPMVLTPHAGEYRTLFPEMASQVAIDPWAAAEHAARTLGAALLLKGVPTVVAQEGRATVTVAAGNPGLATGGSGDTLSGIIAAFLARGLEPSLAAALGAQALGDAADHAARRVTPRSLRPTDVLTALPDVWRRWGMIQSTPAALVTPALRELPMPARM